MVNNEERDKFKITILNHQEDGDNVAEERTVQVLDDDGKPFDLSKLKDTIKSVRNEQDDKCKDIISLGGGIVQDSKEAHGFMIGWITSKIIQAHEEATKKKCHITVTDVKDLTRDDLMKGTADDLEKMAKFIRENIGNEDVSINKLPTNPFDGISQYE